MIAELIKVLLQFEVQKSVQRPETRTTLSRLEIGFQSQKHLAFNGSL
jgi:hypothetical protein